MRRRSVSVKCAGGACPIVGELTADQAPLRAGGGLRLSVPKAEQASTADAKRAVTMEKLVNLCKRRGIVFPASEIYGGLGSTWDYGPLGIELKRNVKEAWWRAMVTKRGDVVGLDSAILQHPRRPRPGQPMP
jgi:hypothetical protein